MTDAERLKLKSLLSGVKLDITAGRMDSATRSLEDSIASLKSGRFPDAGRAAEILLENLDAEDADHFANQTDFNLPDLICLYERILRGGIEKLRLGFTAGAVSTLESLAELMLLAMDELTERIESQAVRAQEDTGKNIGGLSDEIDKT